MKLGMNELKKDGSGAYEYFLLVDADNQVAKDYVRECNKAADEGVLLGRTFENSKNLTDNIISCMTGLWYARDDRFACRARSALHMGCVMNGCCSMIKSEYALNWDAMSTSDDIEFTLNRLYKDHLIVDFINEATLYEDQPTTMADVNKRNKRMGHGLFKLYFDAGLKTLNQFFKNLLNPQMRFSLKMSFLDQYSNIAIIPASLICVIWFPVYYIYALVYTIWQGPMVILGMGSYTWWWFAIYIAAVAIACYAIPFLVQPMIAYFSDRKRFVVKDRKVVFWSLLLFPFFELLNLGPILKGIFTKPKWAKPKRSKTKV